MFGIERPDSYYLTWLVRYSESALQTTVRDSIVWNDDRIEWLSSKNSGIDRPPSKMSFCVEWSLQKGVRACIRIILDLLYRVPRIAV